MSNLEYSLQSRAWQAVFDRYRIEEHNFDESPYLISALEIKQATSHFETTGAREVRILCKQDTRESRPDIFKRNNLFLLPVRNGRYAIINGEGYVNIPLIEEEALIYKSQLDFHLDTSLAGNSEMQHLDFAYACSLIRFFTRDDSLVLTIRGRKYTPNFDFFVNHHHLSVASVQTEVDAGYEGKEQVVLIEAKGLQATNVIIRQLYFPFRQWQLHTSKKVVTMFFTKKQNIYYLWEFEFTNLEDYNSIKLVRSGKFKIV